MEKVKLKITTLTPVSIGSGAELSPYADYVFDNEKVCFIDKKKMVDRIMAKGDEYLDNYVYGMANGMDPSRTKSYFDLKSFLTGNHIVKDIDEIITSKCALVGDKEKKHNIKGIVKSPLAEPYFPGSSIKGALKTVMMYNWLCTSKSADKSIEDVINNGNFDWLQKEFEYKEDALTHDIIRNNTIQQVTDSRCLNKNSNVVVDCYRKMPIRLECIAKNQTTEFELVLEKYKWLELAKQANKYAVDTLEREFALVEEQDNLINYFNFLADIEEEILEAEDNTAFLRLGFGKGYYMNSLGIAIYDYVSQDGKEHLYKKFEDFVNKEYARRDKFGVKQEILLEDFPKTRLYVTKTKEPLGWVKINISD